MHGLSLGTYLTNEQFPWGRSGHSHHAHHGHHAHHSERAEHHDHHGSHQVQETPSSGDETQGTVKQALVNQIKITLTQRFEFKLTSVAVAGSSADEQASSDLAGAVGSALNSQSNTPPQDAVAAVDAAANDAIQQTAPSLPSGAASSTSSSPTELDSAISQISDQLQSLYSAFLANADATSSGNDVTASGATLITNTKGLLEIHTQEGDTVTLGFASKSGVSVQNLNAANDSIQLAGSDIQAFSKNRVTISVQGELNAEELQAIKDLVDQVNQLADGFFGGDVNAVLSQTNGLNFDGSQLADYSLQLALKQTFEAYGLNINLQPVAGADQSTAPTAGASGSTTTDSQPTDTNSVAADSVTIDNGVVDGTKIAVAA